MIKLSKSYICNLNQNLPLYLMLYTRNKDCFKKTTARVEHNQARKNILNLVKEAVERDTLIKFANC
jgi:hypothetical protein